MLLLLFVSASPLFCKSLKEEKRNVVPSPDSEASVGEMDPVGRLCFALSVTVALHVY